MERPIYQQIYRAFPYVCYLARVRLLSRQRQRHLAIGEAAVLLLTQCRVGGAQHLAHARGG